VGREGSKITNYTEQGVFDVTFIEIHQRPYYAQGDSFAIHQAMFRVMQTVK